MQPPSKEPEESVGGIWSAYKTLVKIFQRQVSFGHPDHPIDPAHTTPQAGITDVAHNGLLDNINGSWVEVNFTDPGPERCYHNLGISVVTGVNWNRNVRWFTVGLGHDDFGTDPASSAMTVYWKRGDPVTANYIDLRLAWTPIVRVVNTFHPLKATLFFIPAVRG
jgi:hypothetical protein